MRIHCKIILSTFEFACAFHHIFLSKNVKHWFHYPVSIISTQLIEFEGSKMGHRRIYQFYSDVRQCHLFKKGAVVWFYSNPGSAYTKTSKQAALRHTLSALGITWADWSLMRHCGVPCYSYKGKCIHPFFPPTPWYLSPWCPHCFIETQHFAWDRERK